MELDQVFSVEPKLTHAYESLVVSEVLHLKFSLLGNPR